MFAYSEEHAGEIRTGRKNLGWKKHYDSIANIYGAK